MDCDLHYFGLTIYIMYFCWVSLGWFYPLDIHCDYSFISPFCGVAQTPDCGMLVVHLPFKKPFMWCRPDARLRHYYSCSFLSRSHSDPRLAPVLLFLQFPLEESFRPSFGTQYFILEYFLIICVHHGLSHISWQMCDHLINPEHVWYIVPVFLMFASTFKRTHWLVPGYCLGQIPYMEESVTTTAPKPL